LKPLLNVKDPFQISVDFLKERIELPPLPGAAAWVWVLDPIDGTKSFITGKPLFGTLIALVDPAGVPVLGVIDQPVLRERWVGVAGRRTTLNGQPIATRPCDGGLWEAYMYSTTPLMFEGGNLTAYNRLAGQVRPHRRAGQVGL
jgi:inositol-phosphate phosphatase/L-galactose 1-phosphate phosphatase/histidinol-phosphatase